MKKENEIKRKKIIFVSIFPSIFELNKLFNHTEMLSNNKCAVLWSFAKFQLHLTGSGNVTDCKWKSSLPLQDAFRCWISILNQWIT